MLNSLIPINYQQMAEKRPWSMQQDRLLKYVFETSKLTKWSHIARRLQEQYGVKGRNGKQCKERYLAGYRSYSTHIDTNYPKEEWSYEDQQRMVELHNELGNKWAVIGSKLGGRSDNCVKNHFYALLRKALRKINRVIQLQFRKEYKQFNPTVLYRIVEVTEERFKLFPSYQPKLCDFSQQLKNELIEFSYDDGIDTQEDIDVDQVREFIDKINEFGCSYKKKSKKERKGSGQGQDLLTPTRYHQPEKEESQGNNSFFLSSDTSNVEDLSDDELNRSNHQTKSRKNSVGSAQDLLPLELGVRSRVRSQCNLHASFSFTEEPSFKMQEQSYPQPFPEPEVKIQEIQLKGDISGILGQQGIMAGLQILEEESVPLPTPNLLHKTSRDYRFFEESGIQMRILPEMELQGRTHDNYFT